MSLLPPGFAGIEPLVADWVLPDAAARMAKRQASGIAELRRFYDAMLARGEEALAWLRGFALGDLPPEGENLLRLMLMLAEAAPAVEWYGDPRVYDGFPVERVRYLRQIPDCAAQAVAS
ncbi:MAG: hypothetical protein KGM17_14055 [Sphingomonadales bacterium]|nr:hypothetical protein [Sphingomonadales bacterium]